MADAPTLAPLSPTERDMFARASTAPMDVIQGDVKSYIDRMIDFKLQGAGRNWTPPIGSPLFLLTDLTAETAEYVYTDERGIQYLYLNGVAVSQTTYADLYAFWGANAWGADSGGNFLLPDTRGRALFLCGTHANADLGDNDGAAVADRQAKHAHTDSLTAALSGSPGGTFASSTHTHGFTAPASPTDVSVTAGAAGPASQSNHTHSGTTAGPSATASPTQGTLGVTVNGSVGTGTSGDAPAHIFIGSLLVRF